MRRLMPRAPAAHQPDLIVALEGVELNGDNRNLLLIDLVLVDEIDAVVHHDTEAGDRLLDYELRRIRKLLGGVRLGLFHLGF